MTETPARDRVEPVDLQQEMQRSYIDYAMSVIVGRALPEVRDGLKPVHRRVLYAMYDQGFRPDRSYVKCARVVGEVMGNYHPHGDTSIYDALVRLAQPWSMRYPLVDGQGNFGSPGNDPAAAMRYTEARLTPLAMEMLANIDEDTVDFQPNYDGKNQEPLVLPGRIPNLLINGSAGIAVGMATNMPPHNLREVAAAVFWVLEHPDAEPEEALTACMERVKGPDFPTHGLIVGREGIEDAYRTGRGSVRMRAVVTVEEDSRGRVQLVCTELPYQVNPDNLAEAIADAVKEGRLQGISEIADESSDRVGRRLVITLRRDAVAKVVLNNLYKHTQLQTTFGCNMLSIVDGVPRTLRLDELIQLYVNHQIEVIQRRTRYRLRKAEERAHILRGYAKALDHLDDVITLIRNSESADAARGGLMELLDIDEIQATAILDMQLRRLAALERQRILDELAEIEAAHRRPAGDPRLPRAAAADHPRRAGRDRREVRRRPAHAVRRQRRRRVDGGPHRGGGGRRHHHPHRLREADEERPLPLAAPRRQGRDGCGPQAGRHRRPLLRGLHPRLDPVLHEQGPGLPLQGLRAARGQPHGPGPARGEHPGVPAGREDRPGHADQGLLGRPVPGAGHGARTGEEDPADRLRLPAPGWRHRHQPARRRRAGRGRADRARTRTCSWSPARRCRSGSPPTTPRCGRWAGPPRVSAGSRCPRTTGCCR